MTFRSTNVPIAEWPVAILAGGLARRLRPITETIPKGLVSVAGSPFLVHQLELLRSQGFRQVVLCVGYLGEMIERELGNGESLGMQITYSLDGSTLLGTGGALKNALPLLGPQFVVVYGDAYLMFDHRAAIREFISRGRPALMTVFRNENQWDASNVWFEDGEIRCYDKKRRLPEMRHIDYGLGVLRAEVFCRWSDQETLDLADVYSTLAAAGQLAGHEVKERFYEVGSRAGLAELEQLLGHRAYWNKDELF